MRTRLEFELSVDLTTFDARNDFLEAAVLARSFAQDLKLPPATFRITAVHAEQVAGENGGFIAAGAGANFEKNVRGVVRVARQQQREQALLGLRADHLQARGFVVGECAQFRIWVAREGCGLRQLGLDPRVLANRHNHRLQLRELSRQRGELLAVGNGLRFG